MRCCVELLWPNLNVMPCCTVLSFCEQRLEALVHDVEPDIFTPDFVAEEVSSAT